MTTTNNLTLKIDEKIQNYAKIYASLLSDEYQRKRAYASLVALYAFVDILEPSYNVQKSMTLFRNPQINEQYEIADIYVNGWHIDVRVVTGGDAVLIPKIHYDSDIVPDYYVVVKVDSTLQNAELIGAIDAKNVEKEAFDYHYYSVGFSSLISYKDLLSKLEQEKVVSLSEEEHELFRNSYLTLLDNNLDKTTKNKVLKHLFECSVCRTEFCCFTGFEMVCSNSSKYPEILDDHTLGYVGAQNVENSKYVGKEETIYIGSDNDDVEDNVSDIVEDKSESNEATVSAILDDLFDIDEGQIEEDVENVESEEENLENASNQNDEISSLDDILEEVAASSNINVEEKEQNKEEEIKEDKDLIIEDNAETDKELQLIEDSVFLDVPSKYPEIVADDGEMHIIADENVNPYEKNEDINVLSDEEKENAEEKEEILVLSEEDDGDLVEIISDEDNAIVEEKENSEIETIQDEIQEVYPTDEELIINDNESNEFENIEDEIIDEATMLSKEEPVQKVIVDYDDFGEPIYSYITEIDENQNNDDSFEIKEEEFEEYPDEEEKVSEIEDISDLDEEEEYESVYSSEDAEDETSNDAGDVEEIDNDTETEEYEEENTNEEQTIENEENNDDENSEEESLEENSVEKMEEDETEMQNYEEENNQYEENDDEEYEDDEEEYEERKSSNPLAIIISILVLLGLAGGGVFYFLTKSKSSEETTNFDTVNENVIETVENPAVNDMFEQPVVTPQETATIENQGQSTPEDILPELPTVKNNVTMPELTESDLIKPQQRRSNGDVNKTIVNAFATNQSPVSLRALNWFCASSLFSDMNFKNYLQTIDDSLKQNLKSNFMNLVEAAPNDSVAAKFAVDNRGNLKKVIISETSGSEEIDNVVLQSIKETFEREKSQILNDTELKQDMYYLKVVIKL